MNYYIFIPKNNMGSNQSSGFISPFTNYDSDEIITL